MREKLRIEDCGLRIAELAIRNSQSAIRNPQLLFRRPQRAFTLVEVLVSVALVSLVFIACSSTMIMTVRALDASNGNDAAARAVLVRTAIDQMAAELKVATAITEQTPTAVTFTVPDRNGDNQPETIRYCWAGPRTALTRQYNGAPVPAAAWVENVENFGLEYLLKTVGPPPPVEGAEQVLASRDWPTAGDIKSYQLKSDAWPAEYFKPAMPTGAVSWKITRIKVKLQRSGSKTGTVNGEIWNADASLKPIGGALAGAAVDIAGVSSTAFVWVEFPFSTLGGLDPKRGMCIALTTAAGDPGFAAYDQKGSDPTMAWCTSSNSGASWSATSSSNILEFYVYGAITVQP
jgi:prepilin-type N-terminal cleavage/methylation domain-containing protein